MEDLNNNEEFLVRISRKETIEFLNGMTRRRVRLYDLENELSEFFRQDIKVELICEDDTEATDHNYSFIAYGFDFDIYFLKTRIEDTIYITETSHDVWN